METHSKSSYAIPAVLGIAFVVLSVLVIYKYLPETVYGTIVAGILASMTTIYGISRQNDANALRQKELLKDQEARHRENLQEQSQQFERRLAHEAKMKAEERVMNLRKDIYLEGIVGLSKMGAFVLSFADGNTDSQSRGSILANSGDNLAKVSTVATLETITALGEVDKIYKEALTLLTEKRLEFDNCQNKIKSLEDLNQILYQHNEQILEILKTDRNPNQGTLDQMNDAMEKNFRESNQNIEEINRLKHELLNYYNELNRLAFDYSGQLNCAGAECVLMIRREMDFPIDEEKVREMVKINSKETAEHFPKFIENIIEKHRNEI